MVQFVTTLVELDFSCGFRGIRLDIEEGSIVLRDLNTNIRLYADSDEKCNISMSGGLGVLKFVYQDYELLSLGVPELSVDYVDKTAKITSQTLSPLTLSFSNSIFQSVLVNNFGKICRLAQAIAEQVSYQKESILTSFEKDDTLLQLSPEDIRGCTFACYEFICMFEKL